jgi:hypothetical protein
MALLMTADGTISESELDEIRPTWERIAGGVLDESAFASDASLARSAPDELWSWLEHAGQTLTDAEKEVVIKAAVLVVMADAELADGEVFGLSRLARALKFDALRRVMNETWREARDRG